MSLCASWDDTVMLWWAKVMVSCCDILFADRHIMYE